MRIQRRRPSPATIAREASIFGVMTEPSIASHILADRERGREQEERGVGGGTDRYAEKEVERYWRTEPPHNHRLLLLDGTF